MAATKQNETLNITCNWAIIEQVAKYLGSIIAETYSTEIRARLRATRSTLPYAFTHILTIMWKDRTLDNQIKIKLLKTLVWPVALDGSESWTLKAKGTDKLKDFVWQMYAANQNRRIRDERDRCRQRTGNHCKEAETTVLRAHDPSTEPLHIHFEACLDGARGRGRPRRRWGDDIKDWIGKTLAECMTTARDRKTWRELMRRSVVSDLQ